MAGEVLSHYLQDLFSAHIDIFCFCHLKFKESNAQNSPFILLLKVRVVLWDTSKYDQSLTFFRNMQSRHDFYFHATQKIRKKTVVHI